tara:strand:+ start:40845 stop:42866 length:2022 start_codon:yes stop_codon:yes gene_type:complete
VRLLLFFFLCCYAQTIYSQDEIKTEDNLEPILFKNIKEVVVTGQLTDKSTEEAVHKIRVITAKQLESGLFTDLGQVLEKELNIRLSQDNILGSSISLQGISGQNVKILIDEIPVIGRLNGNIDLSQISLNNIERIEVVEGTLSTLYGTDALAGTINIITKKSSEFKKSFNSYYETVGKYDLDFMLAKDFKNKTIIYQFERNFFNGWSENQEYKIIPLEEIADENRFKQWKPKEQFINKVQYNIQENDVNIYNYIESFSEKIINRGLPREPYFENAFDEYYYTNRMNIGSNINFKNNNDNIKVLLAYNNYLRVKERFYKDLTTLNSILVEDPSAQDTSSFNLMLVKASISNNEDNNLQYQFGLEAQSESAKGDRILDTRKVQSDYALFTTIEYKPNNTLTFRPSARAIYNTNYNAPFIPALNILLDFSEYKLRFGMAKGFRAPSLKELYLEFVDINHNIVGNENLLAETSSNYHLSNTYKYSMDKTIIITDLNLFYNMISNKIDLTNSKTINGQYSYFNIDEYKTKGVSTNINISRRAIEINMGLSYIGRYNKLSSLYISPEFNFSTDYSFSTIFNIDSKNKLNIFYKYVGKIPVFLLDEENIVESYIGAYSLLDISINRRINEVFILSLGGKNLLNITNITQINNTNTTHSYSNNSLAVSYGRTFFLSLKLNL